MIQVDHQEVVATARFHGDGVAGANVPAGFLLDRQLLLPSGSSHFLPVDLVAFFDEQSVDEPGTTSRMLPSQFANPTTKFIVLARLRLRVPR
ncbi:hypothetical protein M1R55_22885 (plasmid) [Deinococcus sp. QL22]|nr:hypothetical protein [Deinococcus sp. QL22]UQN09405.1 hypothetical protein M1R55_22885 [Deinococcus sp. QL22]